MTLIANVVVSNTGDTFGTWVQRTNQVIARVNSFGLTANTLTVNAITANTVDANTLSISRTSTFDGNVTFSTTVETIDFNAKDTRFNANVEFSGSDVMLEGGAVSVNGHTISVSSNTIANGSVIVNGDLTVNNIATFTSNANFNGTEIENQGILDQKGRASFEGGIDSKTGDIQVTSNVDFVGTTVTNQANVQQNGTLTLDGTVDSSGTIDVASNTEFSGDFITFSTGNTNTFGTTLNVTANSTFSGQNTDISSTVLLSGTQVTITSLNTSAKNLADALDEVQDNALAFAVALG